LNNYDHQGSAPKVKNSTTRGSWNGSRFLSNTWCVTSTLYESLQHQKRVVLSKTDLRQCILV
jgi:hypothetical protein